MTFATYAPAITVFFNESCGGHQIVVCGGFNHTNLVLSSTIVSECITNSPTTTYKPTHRPTKTPMNTTTHKPTRKPTRKPTKSPTNTTTHQPSKSPTKQPTVSPTHNKTKKPTRNPSNYSSTSPTYTPPTSSPSTTKHSGILTHKQMSMFVAVYIATKLHVNFVIFLCLWLF